MGRLLGGHRGRVEVVVDPDRLEPVDLRRDRHVVHHRPLLIGRNPDQIKPPTLRNEDACSHGPGR